MPYKRHLRKSLRQSKSKFLLAAIEFVFSSAFPSAHQPIAAQPKSFPKMTFVGHFASRLSTRKISIKNTFY